MKRPLLLPANLPPGVNEVDAPRVDFIELARVLDADILYPPAKSNTALSRLETRTATDLRQAQLARKRAGEVSVYVSLSEKVGLPLALYGTKNVPHVLVAHHLTSPRKRLLQKRTGWLHRFSHIVVVSRAQETYLRDEVGVPGERVTFITHSVDEKWWGSGLPPDKAKKSVLAVGRERRDYETLAQAARLLPHVSFAVLAGSAWAEKGAGPVADVLPNMTFLRGGRTFAELRILYHAVAVVALPLIANTDYAAGSTALMEAFACAKPVVVTETPGLAGYAADGKNARLIPPADPAALANALQKLLASPDTAHEMGESARQVIDAGCNLDNYVNTLAEIVRSVASQGSR